METLIPGHRQQLCNARLLLVAGLALFQVAGCAVGNQIVPSTTHRLYSLPADSWRSKGVALLTPSVVTGQEQDRQPLALIAAETLSETVPGLKLVTLAETVGAVNAAGLAESYRRMYEDYAVTGLFRRDVLLAISRATGARYLAQFKLAGFTRDTRERWSIFGFRVFQTLNANIRIYVQFWDGETGTIAWEAMTELSHSYDSVAEQPVAFRVAASESLRQLVRVLP